MQTRTQSVKLALGTLMSLSLGTVIAAQAGPPKTIVAVFSEEDAQFAETITLYSDGKYQQAETDKNTKLYHTYSNQHPFPQDVPPVFREELPPLLLGGSKRTGTWRVLDKEAGQPIAFKTLASLPKDAVIEVKGAMQFGVT